METIALSANMKAMDNAKLLVLIMLFLLAISNRRKSIVLPRTTDLRSQALKDSGERQNYQVLHTLCGVVKKVSIPCDKFLSKTNANTSIHQLGRVGARKPGPKIQ
jgi:hypothetical protein